MANTDRARKLLVRTALATSTTIATLIGAQNFAMLDARQFQTSELDSLGNLIAAPAEGQTSESITRSAPQLSLIKTAPNITILRQSDPANTTANLPTVQPPASTQITAPNPVIVFRPIPMRSRSSR